MPTYVYEVMGDDGAVVGRIEAVQRVNEPRWTHDPVTGRPVRRIITGVTLCLRHAQGQVERSLSREHLERHGFTRYEREGSGSYVRTAGHEGPEQLRV